MYLQADHDAGSPGKGFCVVPALSWAAAAGLGDQRVLGGAGCGAFRGRGRINEKGSTLSSWQEVISGLRKVPLLLF